MLFFLLWQGVANSLNTGCGLKVLAHGETSIYKTLLAVLR